MAATLDDIAELLKSSNQDTKNLSQIMQNYFSWREQSENDKEEHEKFSRLERERESVENNQAIIDAINSLGDKIGLIGQGNKFDPEGRGRSLFSRLFGGNPVAAGAGAAAGALGLGALWRYGKGFLGRGLGAGGILVGGSLLSDFLEDQTGSETVGKVGDWATTGGSLGFMLGGVKWGIRGALAGMAIKGGEALGDWLEQQGVGDYGSDIGQWGATAGALGATFLGPAAIIPAALAALVGVSTYHVALWLKGKHQEWVEEALRQARESYEIFSKIDPATATEEERKVGTNESLNLLNKTGWLNRFHSDVSQTWGNTKETFAEARAMAAHAIDFLKQMPIEVYGAVGDLQLRELARIGVEGNFDDEDKRLLDAATLRERYEMSDENLPSEEAEEIIVDRIFRTMRSHADSAEALQSLSENEEEIRNQILNSYRRSIGTWSADQATKIRELSLEEQRRVEEEAQQILDQHFDKNAPPGENWNYRQGRDDLEMSSIGQSEETLFKLAKIMAATQTQAAETAGPPVTVVNDASDNSIQQASVNHIGSGNYPPVDTVANRLFNPSVNNAYA